MPRVAAGVGELVATRTCPRATALIRVNCIVPAAPHNCAAPGVPGPDRDPWKWGLGAVEMIVLPLGWAGSAYEARRAAGKPAGSGAKPGRRVLKRRGVMAAGRPVVRAGRDLVLALGWTSGSYGRSGARVRHG